MKQVDRMWIVGKTGRQAAFTLVELLVVLFCLALLVGAVCVACGAAKAYSRRVFQRSAVVPMQDAVRRLDTLGE